MNPGCILVPKLLPGAPFVSESPAWQRYFSHFLGCKLEHEVPAQLGGQNYVPKQEPGNEKSTLFRPGNRGILFWGNTGWKPEPVSGVWRAGAERRDPDPFP